MVTDVKVEQQVQSDGLSAAPDHIKLAVDLICLLENNKIENDVALRAIDIVRSDLQQKLEQQ